jgi:hypothetical protein
VLDLDIDVVLIQEPYAYSAEIPVVANIPPGFSAFHHLSNDHAYGSVILIKDSISTADNLSVMHLSNFASCVELHTKSGPLRFASIYLRPSISDFASTVQSIFDALSSPYSVFGLDFNTKNRVWNSSVNDRRGEDLETVIFGSGLNIANRLCDELDFVPGGTAFVDLTLTGPRLFISRWAFLAMPSLSDHSYIYFQVDSPVFTPKPKAHPNKPIPSLSNMNLNLYRSKLLAASTTWPRSLTCSYESEVEEHINVLVTSIHSCAQAVKTFRPVLSRAKSMPW